MSQEMLGSILGIQKAAVEDLESGRNSNLRADTIKLLCETFHEYPGVLLYGRNHNYWDRMLANKVGDEKHLLDTEKHGLSDGRMLFMIKSAVEDLLGAKGLTLMNDVRLLNDMGMKRAKVLIADLLKIKEYQKEN